MRRSNACQARRRKTRAGRTGLLVALAEGPAVAPYAAARIGIPGTNEAGLSYSGQGLRGDLRHAFEWGNRALSAGVGVSGLGLGQSGASDPPGTDLSGAHGVGVDLPILFGYRTDADVISVWAGLRGSFDHWSGKVSLDPGAAFELGANRLAFGPIFGCRWGFRRSGCQRTRARLRARYRVAGPARHALRRPDQRLVGSTGRRAGGEILAAYRRTYRNVTAQSSAALLNCPERC